LDPFTGSGTVQVEALTRGISSVGIDIDPLACLIARAKTTLLNPEKLQRAFDKVQATLTPFVKAHSDQETIPGSDISKGWFEEESAGVAIPPIPNIIHWFRRYVIVDLARIFWALEQSHLSESENQFFRACVVAIIRRVSNADPAPVSGLEVTSIQAKKNATRKIRVFDVFFTKTRQAIQGMEHLWNACHQYEPIAVAQVRRGDALDLTELRDSIPLAQDGFPLVITSPPYCRSVEYSRRHQLEMYWLGMIRSPAEHVALTHTYIGRKLVRASDWDEKVEFGIEQLDDTLHQIMDRDPKKARTVRHYFYSMWEIFGALNQVVKRSGTVVCVIGNSVCCQVPIPTVDVIAELAADHFKIKNRFSYALRNHYMQYGLWNGDGIKQEYVLVMKPR